MSTTLYNFYDIFIIKEKATIFNDSF